MAPFLFEGDDMLIRSKIARNKPGVVPPEPIDTFPVELGKNRERRYDFKLNKEGEHVCEVNNTEDVTKLLSITEGYEIHPSEVGAYEKAKKEAAEKSRKETDEIEEYNAKLGKMSKKQLEAEMKARGIETVDEDATLDDLRALLRKPLPGEATT